MVITAIKAQVKHADRVSIYIDGVYSLSLNHGQLLEQKLRTGLAIDEPRLQALKELSEAGKLYDRLLRYALVRPRSRREVEDYCRRKAFEVAQVQPIIERLIERGYIDDEHFARAWIESRRLHKPISERRLRLELAQKGISNDIVAHVMNVDGYDQLAALKILIAKKQRRARYQDEQKLMQYLIRQGFPYDDIRQVLGALGDS